MLNPAPPKDAVPTHNSPRQLKKIDSQSSEDLLNSDKTSVDLHSQHSESAYSMASSQYESGWFFTPETHAQNLREDVSIGSASTSYFPRTSVPQTTEETLLAKPFVPRLLARSVSSEGEFKRWVEQNATLMFVDISGFSSIASRASGQEGSFSLFHRVNTFFTECIKVIQKFEGEVLKFIGDAICAVWTEEEGRDAEQCCLLAVECALNLIKTTTENSNSLKVHVGIRNGPLILEVFSPHRASSKPIMPTKFVFVGGPVFADIGKCVDVAQEGELCVSSNVFYRCNAQQKGRVAGVEVGTETVETLLGGNRSSFCLESADAKALSHLETYFLVSAIKDPGLEHTNTMPPLGGSTSMHIGNEMMKNSILLSKSDSFVHGTIVDKLRSGVPLDHCAQIRDLVVLFIQKKGPVHLSDWFGEMYEILEEKRCPILQVMEDDKGAQLLAAVNLYRVEEGAADTALQVIKTLIAKEVSCTVGVASGSCYCGPVGSEFRCQWDVYGDACVRACRLMQYGCANNINVVLDYSVVNNISDRSGIKVITFNAKLPKTKESVAAFTLEPTKFKNLSHVGRITEFVKEVREKERTALLQEINQRENSTHSFAVVSGAGLSGKKVLILSALCNTKICPIIHKGSTSRETLSIAHTFANWFVHYDEHQLLKKNAESLQRAIESKKSVTKLFELCLALVDSIITSGVEVAIVLDHLQYVDHSSLHFLADCLKQSDEAEQSSSPNKKTKTKKGRILWLGSYTPMADALPLSYIMDCIVGRSNILVIELQRMSVREQSYLFQSFGFWSITEKTAQVLLEKTGGMPGQFITLMQWFGPLLAMNFVEFRKNEIPRSELLCDVTKKGVLILTKLGKKKLLGQQFRNIYPGYLSKFVQFSDALSTDDSIILQVVSILSHFYVTASVQFVSTICTKFLLGSQLRRSSSSNMMKGKNSGVGDTDRERVVNTLSERMKLLQNILILEVQEQFAGRPSTCTFYSPVMREAIFDTTTPRQVRVVCLEGARILDAENSKEANNVDLQASWSIATCERSLNQAKLLHGAKEKDKCMNVLKSLWMKFSSLSKGGSFASRTVMSAEQLEALQERENGVKQEVFGYMKAYGLLRSPNPAKSTNKDTASSDNESASLNNTTTLTASVSAEISIEDGRNAVPLDASQLDSAEAVLGSSTKDSHALGSAPKVAKQIKHGVDDKIEEVKNFECPLVLGPICGLVNRLGLTIVTHSLTVAGADDRVFPDITADDFMSAISAFEKEVPLIDNRPAEIDLVEERKLIDRLLAPVKSVQQSIENACLFLEYTEKVVSYRVERISKFVKSETGMRKMSRPDPQLVADRPYGRGLKAALLIMENLEHEDSTGSGNGKDNAVNAEVTREALVQLAVANWASPIPYLTTAKLRDAWFWRWISEFELKAIVWLFLVVPFRYE